MINSAKRVTGTRHFFRTSWNAGCSAIILVPFIVALGAQSAVAAPKPPISTPLISCAGATQTSINVQVCAGATGLPAGFTLEWLKAADYAANGNHWLSDSNPLACSAGFSGNANLSRYNLAPGECVTVNVGDFLFDNGASTNCPVGLECGTQYVFRAFGHATSTMSRSDFTTTTTCTTLDCGHASSCTLTQGYWKTHGAVPTGNNEYVWPDTIKVNGLQLGNVSYTAADLLSILNKPAGGNGLIALAHQLIAAKLNVAAGADPTTVAADIATADALIANLIVPPLGSGYLAPSLTSGLVTVLTNYNEGATGPGHCDDQEPVTAQ
jgi:hypothetical protein